MARPCSPAIDVLLDILLPSLYPALLALWANYAKARGVKAWLAWYVLMLQQCLPRKAGKTFFCEQMSFPVMLAHT